MRLKLLHKNSSCPLIVVSGGDILNSDLFTHNAEELALLNITKCFYCAARVKENAVATHRFKL